MTWLSQNKVRPGAYFNFTSVERPDVSIGDRGIATIPIELDWGKTGELIEVYSDELLNGDSLAKIGFTAFDENSKLVNIMLQYCYKVLLYRTNTAGVKATTTIGDLTITAKYTGIFGNNITVAVVANGETLFDVSTYVNGSQVDKQTVAEIVELTANDFVEFSGTGELSANAGKPLTGGTNGTTPTKATYYPLYLALLETANFQTLGCPDLTDDDATLKANIVTFVNNQRETEEKSIQGVVANYPTADYEGIISVKNGVYINSVQFSKEEMAGVVAAMTAGSQINQSNTNRKINGATGLVTTYKNSDIIAALQNGEFVFTANQRGEIKVEQDINSLHTFTPKKNYDFSKNRVIRVLDDFKTMSKDKWEQSYMGKVDNNEDGRALFKQDICANCLERQRVGALQNFEENDITVSKGQAIDAVLMEAWLQPVDAMEKLYVDCKVAG